jgi:hypothetical protein
MNVSYCSFLHLPITFSQARIFSAHCSQTSVLSVFFLLQDRPSFTLIQKTSKIIVLCILIYTSFGWEYKVSEENESSLLLIYL